MTSSTMTNPPATLEAPGRDGVLWCLKAGANAAMVVGAVFVAWSAWIHLDLWQNGYRQIPTIGTLFLLQTIAGFSLAAVVALTRRLLPALAGAAFLLSTLGGLIWSVEWGLFGFQDSFNAPFAGLALAVEIIGVVVLLGASVLRIKSVRRSRIHPEWR